MVNQGAGGSGFDAARAFRSLTNPTGDQARAVLGVLAESAEQFTTELTEGALLDDLRARTDTPGTAAVEDLGRLRVLLEDLEDDGVVNRRTNDRVASVDDLRRRSLFWSLTGVGRAVVAALDEVERAHSASGSLQLTTLWAIADQLEGLRMIVPETAEPDTVFRAVTDLLALQRTFTEEAHRYLTRLNAVTDEDDDELRFHARKTALRTYLQGFLARLDDIAPRLTAATAALTTATDGATTPIDRLLAVAAETGDLPPAHDEEGPAAVWRADAADKFAAIHQWYAATPTRLSALHDAAHGHALGLTRLLHVINRHRHGSRRTSDRLLDAAAFVAATADEHEAMRRFAAVTGLYPAVHVQLPYEDDELVDAGESWLTASPVEVPVSLRDNATRNPPGRTGKVPDRTTELRLVREARRRRQNDARRLAERLTTRGRFHLSELPEMPQPEFELLLTLLATALDAPREPDGTRIGDDHATGLRVVLSPPDVTRAPASITVGDHRFVGPDHLVQLDARAGSPRLEVAR